MLLLAVCTVVLGCVVSNYAQENQPKIGGYNDTVSDNADVVAAAKFAVKAEAKKQKATIKLIEVT